MNQIDNRVIALPSLIFCLFISVIISCSPTEFNLNKNIIFTLNHKNIPEFACFDDSQDKSPAFYTLDIIEKIPGFKDFEIINTIVLNKKDILLITRKHGLYKIKNINESWQRIDTGLPPEVLYPFKNSKGTKPVISHSISADRMKIALLFTSGLYISTDGGNSFIQKPLYGLLKYTELLSVAMHPKNANLILLGSATVGIYYSDNMGESVQRIRSGMPGEPIRSPNFLEEVRSLCFGEDEDTFFAGLGAGNGIYKGSISKRILFRDKAFPEDLYTYPDGDFYMVTRLSYYNGILWVATNRNWRKIIPINEGKKIENRWIRDYFFNKKEIISMYIHGSDISAEKNYSPMRKFSPHKKAYGKRALYISYSFTQNDNYPKLVNLLKYLKLNAVVINLKDDYGRIRVPSSDPMLVQVPGSVKPYQNVVDTIKRLKKDGIYVIGRLVAFKDEQVYAFENNKYAVKNSNTGRPFFKGPEKWVDGFSEFVWDYNIAAAKAFVQAGIDEVQFDYIRFPDVRAERDKRKYDFIKEHQTMREALASFLIKARESIDKKIPISIDLFGYNAIYKWGNWIGQDVTELSQYVDCISPMFYPSHFTGGFAGHYGDKRIFYTIYISSKRTRELTDGVLIRSYIQAFYYKDNSDNYCPDYIGWELDGIKKSGQSDYIFWNDLSEYKIFIRGMRKYMGEGDGPIPPEILQSIPKKLPFDSLIEKGE